MKPKTGKSYIYATWLTGLLAGEDRCVWKAWVKAHFKYEKVKGGDSGFLEQWIKEHDAMTASRVERLVKEDYKVFVEDQNSFKLEGAQAILAGKPDIVATKPEDCYAVIIDEKSGKKKLQHRWQVLIYMFALKLGKLKDFTIHGELEYKDAAQPILPSDLGPDEIKKILDTIKLVGGSAQPATTPSASECRFCDVLECPDRWSGNNPVETTQVKLF